MFDPVEILGTWPEFKLEPPSEHLINCLRSIGDALTSTGKPVYDRSTVINLTTSIASRSYGPELYRAVHVLAAAAMTGTSIDQIILPESPLTGANVIALLQQGRQTEIMMIETHLLRFGDHANGTEHMKISARQLPAAIALIEFLIESLGFETVYQAYEAFTQNADSPSISTTTKTLSAALYRFLGEHLPSASNRQMVQLLSNYITKSDEGSGPIYPEDVSDDLIYEFWCEHAHDDSVSFRLFATAAQAWMTYRNALNLASTDAFSRHFSIDELQEDGQFDRLHQQASHHDLDDGSDSNKPGASSLAEIVGDINAPSQWLQDLLSPPCDQIKFFTKVEQEYIAFPLMAGAAATALTLTCLRVAVFSPLQNKIVQAKRSKAGISPDALFNQLTDTAYQDVAGQWHDMIAVASGLRDTAYFRLWEAKAPQFFTYFAQVGTKEERHALGEITQEQATKTQDLPMIGSQVDMIANAVFAALELAAPSHLLRSKKAQMKETAHRFRRKGLLPNTSDDARAHSDWLDALLVGGERLHKIDGFMRGLTNATDTKMEQLQTHFKQDKHSFGDQLKFLHEKLNDG